MGVEVAVAWRVWTERRVRLCAGGHVRVGSGINAARGDSRVRTAAHGRETPAPTHTNPKHHYSGKDSVLLLGLLQNLYPKHGPRG